MRGTASAGAVALAVLVAIGASVAVGDARAQTAAPAPRESIVLASTTSTDQSGLFGALLPAFTRDTGIAVRVVALGTGQALDVARRGDADAVLVHDPEAERRFVDEGWGIDRRPVMYNDFVIVGPARDPAGLAAGGAGVANDAAAALARIARAGAPFVSRGDRSGTHAAELTLWKAAGLDPVSGRGAWYREAGAGMGPTLNVASGMDGYALTDRATWLAFRNPGTLKILVEGDPRLFNRYSVIRVNPAKHPHLKQAAALAFADWLVSPAGRAAITGYTVQGRQLFFIEGAAK